MTLPGPLSTPHSAVTCNHPIGFHIAVGKLKERTLLIFREIGQGMDFTNNSNFMSSRARAAGHSPGCRPCSFRRLNFEVRGVRVPSGGLSSMAPCLAGICGRRSHWPAARRGKITFTFGPMAAVAPMVKPMLPLNSVGLCRRGVARSAIGPGCALLPEGWYESCSWAMVRGLVQWRFFHRGTLLRMASSCHAWFEQWGFLPRGS